MVIDIHKTDGILERNEYYIVKKTINNINEY